MYMYMHSVQLFIYLGQTVVACSESVVLFLFLLLRRKIISSSSFSASIAVMLGAPMTASTATLTVVMATMLSSRA